MVWIIVGIIWLIGILISYKFVFSKWNNSLFEKIWFSAVWPCIIPLYLIHAIHNM